MPATVVAVICTLVFIGGPWLRSDRPLPRRQFPPHPIKKQPPKLLMPRRPDRRHSTKRIRRRPGHFPEIRHQSSQDKRGQKSYRQKRRSRKGCDPKLRSWSLPEFIRWLQLHGPSVVIILLVVTAILWTANLLHRRIVRLLASYAGRGSQVEQENRARTLVGVMHNSLRTAVIVVGCITILEEVGVPVGPLLGSVAVVGVAVAFGASKAS